MFSPTDRQILECFQKTGAVAGSQPHGNTNQDLVPKPPHQMEKTNGGQNETRPKTRASSTSSLPSSAHFTTPLRPLLPTSLQRSTWSPGYNSKWFAHSSHFFRCHGRLIRSPPHSHHPVPEILHFP